MHGSRRNGKPASCEPCRLNKTKCDHTYPKCNRCHQRGIQDRCFYHPAPLTKPRGGAEDTGNVPVESPPAKRKRTSKQDSSQIQVFRASTPQDDKLADAVAAETYSPGYLGPGSYALLLPQNDGPEELRERTSSVASVESEHDMTHQYCLNRSIRYQIASDILSTLRDYTTIRDLVIWYNASNEAGVIPAQLQVDAINAIEPVVDKYNLRHAPPSPELISKVLENSSKPLCIIGMRDPRDLPTVCCGDNLRFEIIGFLLATAGRALGFGAAPGMLNGSENRGRKQRLIDQLLRASTTCIELCPMLSTTNDLTVWLYYENYLFTALICGFVGPPSWRRMGQLSTQIVAGGLHKNRPEIPLWLSETRRRLFCAAYNQDKAISTFLGRPIHMSRRYTDVKLPLDLSDEELVGDPAELNLAIQAMDKDGWNTKRRYVRASWVRLRHISSRLREEVLEFSLMKQDSNIEPQLTDISARIRSTWAALPQHMRFDSTSRHDLLLPATKLMLVIVHLTHWYNEFMIQKLLDYQPLTLNTGLLRVSIDLLSKVLTLGSMRDRSYDAHRDLLSCILLYGIPSASVLATALREQHATGQSFPSGVSRAEIVRMLSVLISHLDAAVHLENSGARQGEANYCLCRKASKIFTRVIDTVLDTKPSEVVRENGAWGLDMGLDFFSAPGLDGFESMEFSGLGLGVTGTDVVDWGAMGQWTV